MDEKSSSSGAAPAPSVFPLLLAASVILLSACGKSAAPKSARPVDEAVPVTTAVVQEVLWDREIPVSGTLFPKDEAALSAQVEGMVEKTLVDFGDRIQTGQTLALIDTASYEALAAQASATLARARAAARNAEQTLRRTGELGKSGITPPSELEQATAAAEQARAEVKAAEAAEAVAKLNLARSTVKAPFDGAIAQRFVGKGDFVKVGSPLFQAVNDYVLKFIFQVPEKNAAGIAKKQKVRFSVDAYPGQTFEAGVYLISPIVSTTTRAFSVGALVTNVDLKLKADTFARGAVLLEEHARTAAVPLEAVVTFSGITKAFVITNSMAITRTIQVGRIRSGLQEIVSGLAPGEVVALSGQSKLREGIKVRPAQETPRR